MDISKLLNVARVLAWRERRVAQDQAVAAHFASFLESLYLYGRSAELPLTVICKLKSGDYLRAKMEGVSELMATLTRTAPNRPEAQVSDTNYLRSGCHARTQLAHPVMLRSVRFDHSVHLAALPRGPQLRCTGCHTSVGPNSHFAVDTNTCFSCHFYGAAGESAAAGCVTCHALPQGNAGFDHVAAGIQTQDQACAACHADVVAGSAAVEPRECRHCHIESTSQLMTDSVADIHRRHVQGHRR